MQIPAAKIHFPPEDRKKILAWIDQILESGQLTLGGYGKRLEEAFASYVGVNRAIAVNSGTSALEIPLRCFDVENSSVIVPTNTFFATPAAVIHAGGKVIFADCTDNLCLDPSSVKRAIRRDTKGVILVHIGGAVAPQTREVRQICQEHGLFLLEDAAHAHGSTLEGQKAGSFGEAAAFSFYPTKVITSGEGGIITTNDEKLYQRALVFRDQGKAGFLGNIHTEMGYNWRMSEIHAAIGVTQFERLEEFIVARRRVASIYDRRLPEIRSVSPLRIPTYVKSNYYKYIAYLDKGIDRAQLKKELKEKHGVSLSGEVYELPCHLQHVFKEIVGGKEGDFPVSEDLARRMICLPTSAVMTDAESNYVIDSMKQVLK
ncbi:MAG: DegT/DnrJ/EryC1/StrS family aminotransferase [Chloroflexi bacterium]|nr:DegT/DnrJ/EryC1/StrS family aminotransferase [Chloroflexota bacterium]